MIQLSLYGKCLYVTNSLFSPWDQHFYPEPIEKGSHMLQIDCDTDKGGLEINPNFLMDLGDGVEGATLVDEMEYPCGDCAPDIWL